MPAVSSCSQASGSSIVKLEARALRLSQDSSRFPMLVSESLGTQFPAPSDNITGDPPADHQLVLPFVPDPLCSLLTTGLPPFAPTVQSYQQAPFSIHLLWLLLFARVSSSGTFDLPSAFRRRIELGCRLSRTTAAGLRALTNR